MDFQALYTIAFYFVLGAIAGYICEVIYAAAVLGKFVNRGFLNGPYCPIYGFGVLTVAIALDSVKDSLILLFLCSVLLASALEYVTGFILEKLFHQRWWDYSDLPLNLNGYICLKFSLLWGAACVLVVRILIPIVDTFIAKLWNPIGVTAVCALIALMLFDLTLTVANILKLNKRLKRLDELSNMMRSATGAFGETIARETLDAKEKYSEVKVRVSDNVTAAKERAAEDADQVREYISDKREQLAGNVSVAKERLEEALDAEKLRAMYDKLMDETARMQRRLIRAFPGMKSGRYNEQLKKLKVYAAEMREKSEARSEASREKVAAKYETMLPEGAERPFAYGMCATKLFCIFMIGGVTGTVLETIWALLTLGHFEVRVGVVYGPFIPVYGFGAALLTVSLYRLYKKRDLWIFLSSAVIGGAFEYLCSLFQELALGTVSWEYSDTPFNLGGRTNLMYSMIWGLLGLIWVKDFYPFISKQIERIPKKVGGAVCAALAVLITLDMGISAAAVSRQNARFNGIEASNEFERFLDRTYDDEFLAFVYPNMIHVGQNDDG